MAIVLTYPFIAVDEDDGLLKVAFAATEFGEEEYLILQRDLEAEGEEDEIHLERGSQTKSIYGGIERCVLSRQQVLLALSRETALALDTEQELHLQFIATEENFQHLKAGLGRLLNGRSIFEVIY